MKSKLLLLGLILVCTLGLQWSTVQAVTDDFTVRLFIGEDIGPPTTPEFTSVTPVSSTQIDVVWSAATDDIILAGYRLFRDGVQIATTTLLSYSDTGLLASTTYTYMVDAYDSFGKISSSSQPVATTTPAIVIPIVFTTGSENDRSSTASIVWARLLGITVTPQQDQADIDWQTSTPTRYVIRWGQTTSYELGTVSGGVYKRNHYTSINQLEPGTKYFYELVIINGRSILGSVSRGEFMTLPAIITDDPANVLYFRAEVLDTSVSLNWQNPVMSDFAKVRIVRSHLFYPQTPYDGAIVYEGAGQSVRDNDALLIQSPQYYTIFVYDSAGNVSSGAIAMASTQDQLSTTIPTADSETGVISSSGPLLPPPIDIGEETVLSAVEVMLEQDGVIQTLEGKILLAGDIPYIISIPVDALPRHLKTIIVSIQNPTDNKIVSAYLLRLNSLGERYEAVIPAPMVAGQARITLEVFDYNAATVRRISNTLIFTVTDAPVFFPDKLLLPPIWFVIYGFLFLIAVFSLWWFLFRQRQREDNL